MALMLSLRLYFSIFCLKKRGLIGGNTGNFRDQFLVGSFKAVLGAIFVLKKGIPLGLSQEHRFGYKEKLQHPYTSL